MVFLNQTSEIGVIITGITSGMTGDLFFTLLALLCLFIVILLSVGIPMELVIPLTLPFVIGGVFVSVAFKGILAIYIIYLAVLMARQFWLS